MLLQLQKSEVKKLSQELKKKNFENSNYEAISSDLRKTKVTATTE